MKPITASKRAFWRRGFGVGKVQCAGHTQVLMELFHPDHCPFECFAFSVGLGAHLVCHTLVPFFHSTQAKPVEKAVDKRTKHACWPCSRSCKTTFVCRYYMIRNANLSLSVGSANMVSSLIVIAKARSILPQIPPPPHTHTTFALGHWG